MTSSNQPARPSLSRPTLESSQPVELSPEAQRSLPRTCSHGPSHARSYPAWFVRYSCSPSATVLFSVSPCVSSSGTFDPVAPGMRLRSVQKSELWSSLPAWAAQFCARHTGLLGLLTL